MTDCEKKAPKSSSDVIEFVADNPHDFNQGDYGETLKEIIYESDSKTIVVKKGAQFIVQRNGGRIVPVIFLNILEAAGEFLVYTRHAKKIRKM